LLGASCQRRIVYDPDPLVRAAPADIGLFHEDLRLRTRDGQRIAAWFVPAAQRRGTVLYCHGNGGNVGTRLTMVSALVAQRLDVLIFDYRGYGHSEGRPGEQETYLDARAAWDHLVQTRRVPAREIVVWGRSLGGAVAVWLVAQPDVRPAGVVLESTYTSLVEVAEHLRPHLPVRRFLRYRYPSIERIGKIRAPLLYAHSREDEVVPFRLGLALFDAAPVQKRFVELHGRHVPAHLTLPEHADDVDAFLAEVLPTGEDQP
jgi:hypothetical protein